MKIRMATYIYWYQIKHRILKLVARIICQRSGVRRLIPSHPIVYMPHGG